MSIGNGAPRVFLPNASHLAAASASGTLSARSKAHELHAAALRSFGEATPRSGVAVAARGLLETPRSGIGGAARHVPSSPRPSSAPGTGATSPPHARRGPSPRRISSGGSSPPPKYHSCSSGAGSTPTHPLHSADPSGTHHGRPFSHPHIGRPMNAQSLSASLRLDSRLDPRAGPRSARSHSAFLLESLQSQTEAGGYQPQGFVDRQAYAIADRQAAAVDHRHGLIDRSPTADPNWPSGVASPSPDPNWPGGVVADASSSADRDDAPSASSTSPTPRKHKARGSATPRAAGPEPRSSCGGRSRPVPSIRGDGLQPFMQPLMAMLAAAAPEAQPEGEVTIPPQQPMPNVVALS